MSFNLSVKKPLKNRPLLTQSLQCSVKYNENFTVHTKKSSLLTHKD
ncbi:hypothetical protein TREVI0001_0382 [Treponema vincentii ATCC 35580]|uniref:Uncharacterized protein n=1 Tax=Treponema vincentii ATCC 35580 TaxID=596324 RepID=C8PTG5_9SPIR|nr:hypothetical protein TREVI0001_0382 [Treponema vincentii ATCC 35580]